MKAIAARLEKQYPDTNAGQSAVVTPLLENLVGDYRKNLALLLGAVALVLLIACANLANLFAARGAARAREFAIRAAVGATRGQIVRQLLIESLTVAVLGGALGFMIALWSRDALVALGPTGVERFHHLQFDGRVLGFTFLLAGLTSVAFGLWPAWRASQTDVQLALKAGGHGSSDSRAARRTRDLLIVGEIALTLVLLSSAGLVLKSFARVQALSLGFEPRGLLTARIDLPFTIYSDAEKIAPFTHALLEKSPRPAGCWPSGSDAADASAPASGSAASGDPSAAASPSVSPSPSAAAPAPFVSVDPLKVDCAAILSANDVKTIFNADIANDRAKINVADVNADIGQTGRVRCLYGLSRDKKSGQFSLALTQYSDAAAAQKQVDVTVQNETDNGARSPRSPSTATRRPSPCVTVG